MREIRIPVTRLKHYLDEVGITVTALSELSGINLVHLHKCLAGEVDIRNGAVRTMSDTNLSLLQEALHQLSLKLQHIFIFYNTDLEVVKRNGSRYCPDSLEQIKSQLSSYFNMLTLLQYALGCNRSKARNLQDKHSASYGNISQEDVDRVNLFLAEVSTRLDVIILTKA